MVRVISRDQTKKNSFDFLLYTLFLVCIALIAPIISPYEVSEQNLSLGASAPSLQYILGTDVLGRDLFQNTLRK